VSEEEAEVMAVEKQPEEILQELAAQ